MTAAVIFTAWTPADTGTLAVAGLFLLAFLVAYALESWREARAARRAAREDTPDDDPPAPEGDDPRADWWLLGQPYPEWDPKAE